MDLKEVYRIARECLVQGDPLHNLFAVFLFVIVAVIVVVGVVVD
jgi:hypothetical protein